MADGLFQKGDAVVVGGQIVNLPADPTANFVHIYGKDYHVNSLTFVMHRDELEFIREQLVSFRYESHTRQSDELELWKRGYLQARRYHFTVDEEDEADTLIQVMIDEIVAAS